MNPEKIGRYEIKSELGRGGMATVYKAYDPRFEREVAIKVLPREMMHDSNFRIRFAREAKTIAKLEHPAIVPVHDVGEEDGQPYFVMRYMTGGSLADKIGKNPMSIKEAAKILERLSPALDDAHAKGVIHRDLKPGNILFDSAGEPYISDFGIAKITQTQATSMTGGAIIGTPAYMSPEQAQSEPIDGRSDIYSLGVVLYEMLTGLQPYQATTPMALGIKHVTEPIPHILDKNPGLPVAIESVIEKTLAKNRDERFSTAAELSAALSAVSSGASGDEALKTAEMAAARVREEKTIVGAEKKNPKGSASLLPVAGLVGIAILALGAYLLGFFQPPSTPTPTPTVVIAPTTETPAIVTSTPMPPTSIAPTPTPPTISFPISGVDKLAFVANHEIWVMGSGNLRQLTTDGAPKTDLQWMPGDSDEISYISGGDVYIVNATTGVSNLLTTFSGALSAFRISPDGKQVAIALNDEIYIVPFQKDKLGGVHNRNDILNNMQGCINHTDGALTANKVREFRWSNDPNVIAWLFNDPQQNADLIQIVKGITSCDPKRLLSGEKDKFPDSGFTAEYADNRELPDFDWNGGKFVFNTLKGDAGWGYLYLYLNDPSQSTRSNLVLLDAFAFGQNSCCYRDARINPTDSSIFFAFHDESAPQASTKLYYLPIGMREQIGISVTPVALPLPDDFFKDDSEWPQIALHFVK